MKKRAALSVVGVLVAGMVATAAPARADVVDCVTGVPVPTSPGTVRYENGQIRIDPGAVAGDADAVRLMVFRYAGCVQDFVFLGPASCAVGTAYTALFDLFALDIRYVYQDPETGEIVIDVGRLVADATACA